jgi:hypothetical protein
MIKESGRCQWLRRRHYPPRRVHLNQTHTQISYLNLSQHTNTFLQTDMTKALYYEGRIMKT